MNLPDNEFNPELFQETANAIQAEVAKQIVGQDGVVHHVLTGILGNGNVLLEGVPGLGKTLLIRTFGRVLALDFSRIQFTPDLMPADITGTEILEMGEGDRRSFRFQKGPLFANLVLADEINRATPKTQSALLEAMQERTVTVGNTTHPLPTPYFVLATQNPIEQEGTYPLPEAQLDRFLFKVDVPYPTGDEITAILERTTGGVEPTVLPVTTGEQLIKMQATVRRIPVPSDVLAYTSRLVIATQPGRSAGTLVNRYVRYGAGPRGAQAIIMGAKAIALMAGRFNVSFDDVAAIAPAALRHRILLNFEGLAEGIRSDDIIVELLQLAAPSCA